MARADLLLALVNSGTAGDELAFRRATEALIAEERNKKHDILATQLTSALSRKRPGPVRSTSATEPESSELFYRTVPGSRLTDLVLSNDTRGSVHNLVEEHHRRDLLRSHGLEPRHRILLVGPPGGGKTTLAEAVANELAVPLLTVRYEGIIGSFLGETATRMGKLFEQVRSFPCVLFFDEFDAVAKERGDVHETGEIKRVVSSLLLQVDQLPSHVIVIAATNHSELLDRAVWRRMQLRLELPAPTRAGIIEWLGSWSSRTGVDLGYSHRTIADKLAHVSFAELEDFAADVHRRSVLNGPDPDMRNVTGAILHEWANRAGVNA